MRFSEFVFHMVVFSFAMFLYCFATDVDIFEFLDRVYWSFAGGLVIWYQVRLQKQHN